MNDGEIQKIIDKLLKIRALSDARARVRQLERELGGGALQTLGNHRKSPNFCGSRLLRAV